MILMISHYDISDLLMQFGERRLRGDKRTSPNALKAGGASAERSFREKSNLNPGAKPAFLAIKGTTADPYS
jgi:hypothetical protein